jgi:hypothetical protein
MKEPDEETLDWIRGVEDWELHNRMEGQRRRDAARHWFQVITFMIIFFGPAFLFPDWPAILGMAVIGVALGLIYVVGYWVWRGWQRIEAWANEKSHARWRAACASGLNETLKENEYRCNRLTENGEVLLEWRGLTIWLHRVGDPNPWQLQVTGPDGQIYWGKRFSNRKEAVTAILSIVRS